MRQPGPADAVRVATIDRVGEQGFAYVEQQRGNPVFPFGRAHHFTQHLFASGRVKFDKTRLVALPAEVFQPIDAFQDEALLITIATRIAQHTLQVGQCVDFIRSGCVDF